MSLSFKKSFYGFFFLLFFTSVLTKSFLLAHDPAFHETQLRAERFISSTEGMQTMQESAQALYRAAVKHFKRRANENEFVTATVDKLKELVSQQFAHLFVHVLRVWSLEEAKPNPKLHLQRCSTCNLIINAAFNKTHQKPIVLIQPNPKRQKLKEAEYIRSLKKIDQRIFLKFTAEVSDLNGDGFRDSVRFANENKESFDTYWVDDDFDGIVDFVFVLNKGRWICKKGDVQK